MFHPQPPDWEVVESHAVAPVQVLFKEDGVKIRRIAPNETSGCYTFDMHPPRRPSPPPGSYPKNTAAGAGRPRPVSDPTTESTNTTSRPRNKLHRRSQSAVPFPPSTRAVSNPFTLGILKRATLPATTPSNKEPVAVGAQEPKPERRRSLGATFSFLQPRYGGDRLGSLSSPSSPSSPSSGPSTSGSEGGEIVEPGSGSVGPSGRKEMRAQPQTKLKRHSAGPHFPIVRPRSTEASNNNNSPTTPAPAVSSPMPPVPAHQPSYDKVQTKKVLKHARAELMNEVEKAGYNALVVEGWELTVLRQSERYRIKVVYRARPAIAQSDPVGEGIQVPRSPPYLTVLDN